jgi:NAD(P)-dependent dehydrogenase (short-subunit alcohol dehydrogenase family)
MRDVADLEGKVALVTGAASGIGEATARMLAEEGAIGVVTDVNQAGSAWVARDLEHNGRRATSAELDVTDETQWERVVGEAQGQWGRLDILVSNAGIALGGPVADMSLADWRRVMAVNLDGAFLGTKHTIRAMRTAGHGGSIVIVSSASGIKATPGASAYAASKAALRLFAKSVALEVAADGIRVNTVHPSGVETPIWKGTPFWEHLLAQHGSEAAAFAALASTTPLKRFATADEVARAILFLASDASSYVTGTELVVDGGYTA